MCTCSLTHRDTYIPENSLSCTGTGLAICTQGTLCIGNLQSHAAGALMHLSNWGVKSRKHKDARAGPSNTSAMMRWSPLQRMLHGDNRWVSIQRWNMQHTQLGPVVLLGIFCVEAVLHAAMAWQEGASAPY